MGFRVTSTLTADRLGNTVRITVPDTAVLRVGPLRFKQVGVSPLTVIGANLASIAIYLLPFTWYVYSGVAHTYPTTHTTFWFGLIHGYFVIPDFILSWFNHDVAIYQSPNVGFWYDLGFIFGIVVLLASYFRSSSD